MQVGGTIPVSIVVKAIRSETIDNDPNHVDHRRAPGDGKNSGIMISIRRIGINLLNLIPREIGGQERYIRRLIAGLKDTLTGSTIHLYVNRENRNTWGDLPETWRLIPCPVSGRTGRYVAACQVFQ